MCGASLTGEDEVDIPDEKSEESGGWIGSVVIAVLAVLILGGGAYGLHAMLSGQPTAEPTREAVTPSPTSTRRPTATPTETPLPTSTPTPVPPQAHQVQLGETLSDIAQLHGVAVDDILELNPEVDPEFIRAGQVLLIPAGGAASESSQSGEAAESDSLVHTVEAGETLNSIAADYGVSVAVLRTANDLSSVDEDVQAGQSLTIPLATSTPGAGVTNADSAPTVVPTYAPPPLLYPADSGLVRDDAPVLLQWASVSVLQDNEWYELRLWHLGQEVVSPPIRTHATAWRVPVDVLHARATGTGEFHWQVQVVRETGDGVYEAAGPASEMRTFVWRGGVSAETPEATVGP